MKQIRHSKQRELILSLFKDNYTHPTADEVYDMVRKINPKISRGTVYRNLNLLADMGEIRRISMTDGPLHFDCVTSNHYHFFCRQCHKVFDTSIPYQAELNSTPSHMQGFKTEGHRLMLVGLCPDCLKQQNTESAE